MDRRNFIKTAGLSLASVLISDSLFAWINHDQTQLINFPDEVTAVVYDESVKLTGKGNQTWTYEIGRAHV